MPQPSLGDVHVNVALSNISVAYLQDQSVFVADQVFPIIPVQSQSNVYYKFTKSDFFRDEARRRAPGSETAGGGFTLSTGQYACEITGWHQDISDPLRANADSVLGLDRAVTEQVTRKLLIRRERQWASTYFNTGLWGTDITPATKWDVSTSNPLADVEVGKVKILQNTGFAPNTLVLSPNVFSSLRYNPAIRDQFKYTSADSINLQMMARYFNIDKVLVVNAVYDAGVEGDASPTMSFVVGKHALLCYTPDSPGLMTPAAGYTFAWNGYTGASAGTRIKKFRMENLASDRIEGEMAFDLRLIGSDLGYFLNAVVS